MSAVVNEREFIDSNALLEASGFQWRDASHGRRTRRTGADAAAQGGYYFERNGGLVAKRRVELYRGDLLVRFAASMRNGRRLSNTELMDSAWWMNDDRLALLASRALESGTPLVEKARQQLALPADWSDADILVFARPREGVTLAAYAGPGQTAAAGKENRIIPNDMGAYVGGTFYIDQLYVPGLGRRPWLVTPPPSPVAAWLEFVKIRPATFARGGKVP